MRDDIEGAMNCRELREKLDDAFAAGQANTMGYDAALHLQACAACRAFFNAQTRLYGAIDLGVQKLVETPAPHSLLAGVRDRLTSAAPSRTWVQTLVPSSVALLIACGLLLLIPSHTHKTQETKVASVQSTSPKEHSSSSLEGGALGSGRNDLVASSSRPATSRDRVPKPARLSNAVASVIVDQQESEVSAERGNEIENNLELNLALLRPAASIAAEPKAIKPLEIAKLEIPVLAEENQ